MSAHLNIGEQDPLAIVINAWNRVAVFSHYLVAPKDQAHHS